MSRRRCRDLARSDLISLLAIGQGHMCAALIWLSVEVWTRQLDLRWLGMRSALIGSPVGDMIWPIR
jgi:hypothetical protein